MLLAAKLRLVIALAALALLGLPAWAATPPADTLFPATTKGFFSVPNFPQSYPRFKQTGLGRMLDDPALEPFTEDLRRQMREKYTDSTEKLGTTLDDLEKAASGEVAMGVVHVPPQRPGVGLVVDVTGRIPQAQQLLQKVDNDLMRRHARRIRATAGNAQVQAYEIPPGQKSENQQTEHAYYLLQGNLLIGADELPVLQSLARPGQNALASVPGYRQAIQRAQQGLQNVVADARWYIEPIGLLAAIEAGQPQQPANAARTSAPPAPGRPAAADRAATPPGAPPRPKKQDRAQIARKLGFGAIQAVGGFVVMTNERYDFLHYIAVHAPQPWEKSMKMLAFPNGNDLTAEPWVPAEVDSHVAFNIDVVTAEANFEPLFDQLFGEGEQGVWTDVKQSLRDDENGPRVDINRELIDHLGQRATFIIDHEEPITPDSERSCLAIVCKNPQAVAAAVKKSLEPDPSVKHRVFEGFDIWEMTEEPIDVPEVEIDDPKQKHRPLRNKAQEGEEEGGGEAAQRLVPKSAVTVARGHLFAASHVDFLERILKQTNEANSLRASPDYQALNRELSAMVAPQSSFRIFVRQDQSAEMTYELVRANRMPEAKSMAAQLLNKLLTPQGEESRAREIDGSKLPPFDTVRHYFGLSGGAVTTEETGWFVIGFVPKVGSGQPTQNAALSK